MTDQHTDQMWAARDTACGHTFAASRMREILDAVVEQAQAAAVFTVQVDPIPADQPLARPADCTTCARREHGMMVAGYRAPLASLALKAGQDPFAALAGYRQHVAAGWTPARAAAYVQAGIAAHGYPPLGDTDPATLLR